MTDFIKIQGDLYNASEIRKIYRYTSFTEQRKALTCDDNFNNKIILIEVSEFNKTISIEEREFNIQKYDLEMRTIYGLIVEFINNNVEDLDYSYEDNMLLEKDLEQIINSLKL